MTNEAGLQYEDLLKAKEIMSEPGRFVEKDWTPQNCYVNIEYEEKVWSTKDIPHHLSYIVARNYIAPNYTCILQNKGAEIEGKGYGMSESEAIKNSLKQYLQKWSI